MGDHRTARPGREGPNQPPTDAVQLSVDVLAWGAELLEIAAGALPDGRLLTDVQKTTRRLWKAVKKAHDSPRDDAVVRAHDLGLAGRSLLAAGAALWGDPDLSPDFEPEVRYWMAHVAADAGPARSAA